jgi:hypothetical protein
LLRLAEEYNNQNYVGLTKRLQKKPKRVLRSTSQLPLVLTKQSLATDGCPQPMQAQELKFIPVQAIR